jgi:tetratricopeptide (TPR) repeat protein
MSTLTAQTVPSPAGRRLPLARSLFAALFLLAALLIRWIVDSSTTSPTSPPAIEQSSIEALAQLQRRIQRNPNDPALYAQLGLTLLQQVRSNADPMLYAQARQALDEALKRDPQQVDGLVGQGVLALAMHDFAGALQWAERAQAMNPFRAEILGVQVDALVELGRYPEAVTTLQKMVDMRPDLHSYSRVSYLRELHGKVDGAIEAMRMALESAPVGSEPWLWTLTHLGNLYFNRGDLNAAEELYGQALQIRPDYAFALAGQAHIHAARGQLANAIELLKPVSERTPLPEFVILLGEIYEASGDEKAAKQQYGLVNVIQQLNAAAGMNVDLELALFNANHGAQIGVNPQDTLRQAQAAYQARPTIYGADALAWALYKAGHDAEASRYSQEALRLQTQDALLYYHAGLIAQAAGDNVNAKSYLEQALVINPYFSVLYAKQAQQAIDAF